jgi:hypothetical protein
MISFMMYYETYAVKQSFHLKHLKHLKNLIDLIV